MTGNDAIRETLKIIGNEYCSITLEFTRYASKETAIQRGIYTAKTSWIYGDTWQEAVDKFRCKYKEVKSGN